MLYLIIYILNIILLLLYALSLSTVGTLFFIEKNKPDKKILFFLMLYFATWIFDSIIISMTENFTSFEQYFSTLFGGSPLSKTFIYFINNLCMINILSLLSQQKIKITNFISIAIITIWMLILPLFPANSLNVFLFYLPNQLFLIYIGYKFLYYLKNKIILPPYDKICTFLAYANIIFGILITLEDILVIFFIDQYDILNMAIIYRNYSECIFSIIMSALAINYSIKLYKGHQKNTASISVPPQANTIFNDFCHDYLLTEREEEVFKLLLEKKSNQAIADHLYLSLGTVKTHIHNIYAKTNVSKRNELFDCYKNYSK